MPAHAQGVPGGGPRLDGEPALEPGTHPLDDLRRYAGWLGRDHTATAIRADVAALVEAMTSGMGATTHLGTLDADIARLPAGGIRPLLRRAAVTVRTSIERADRAAS